jgi:PRC-barrel domain protein
MLRSIKQLYGDKLGTLDGEIGRAKDFYFDDEKWAVRYVVVDTGSWLSGRLVLISPYAFGNFYQEGDCLRLNLTREQIENSPSIESHKPVSRQYEEEYYRYYGWPSYWVGADMWGTASFPVVPPPNFPSTSEETGGAGSSNDDDPHLRSTKAVGGYQIETKDGPIGHVTDFLIDDKSWTIRQLVIETGHWLFGKEIVISPNHIDQISYEESRMFVNVTKEVILNSAEHHIPRAEYHDSPA